jgi:arylformamidase
MPRIIDLTLPLRPGTRGVSSESTYTKEGDGWNASTWHLYSHAGTHMDAPIHFAAGPKTIDQISLPTCLGPAWVADLRPCSPGMLIEPEHLGPLGELFVPGESLLLLTGWSAHASDPAIYRDQLPRLSARFARWCVKSRVKLLGVEPPSVANVKNLPEVTLIHDILLRGGVTIVEGLAHLDQLTERRVFFAALPLKLAGSDGSPVRAFAVEGTDPDAWSFIS